MKTLTIKIIFISLFVLVLSCTRDIPLPTPQIVSFEADHVTASVEEPITFSVRLKGQKAVIWAGDAGKSYQNFLLQTTPGSEIFPEDEANMTRGNDKGATVAIGPDPFNAEEMIGELTYSYRDAGNYNATLVVTNAHFDEIESVTREIQITINAKQ